jgi:hypothetical protein
MNTDRHNQYYANALYLLRQRLTYAMLKATEKRSIC